MPTRSLRSRVLKWPDKQQVVNALTRWADREAKRPGLVRLGYFGSYARGDWGVGSDVDLVAVLRDDCADGRFEHRAASWNVTGLPVPAELLVYTETEWDALMKRADRFARMLQAETVWLVSQPS